MSNDGKRWQDRADSHYNVVIIGAGISEINVGYRLQTQIPDYTYTILEARSSLDGTWDRFSFPGIRSDSDLHIFGFPWEPWTKDNDIVDGASIKKYMSETATKHGTDVHIRYRKRVGSLDWSSKQSANKVTCGVRPQRPPIAVIGDLFPIPYVHINPMPSHQVPNLSSTYIRAADVLPMSSHRAPWRAKKNYFVGMWNAVIGDVKRGMVFQKVVVSGFRV